MLNGQSALLNQVSSTSGSRSSVTSSPNFARAAACASSAVFSTKMVPSGAYQAGIWCPHQSWRETHQGWMSRIQAKKVFSHCFGTKRMRPVSTASMQGFASVPASQYHCQVSRGSIGTPPRSPCGTWLVCGSIFSSRPSSSSFATIALRATKRSWPARPRTKSGSATPSIACRSASISSSVTSASGLSTVGIATLCRRPTSKSLKSCAGVIFTAPVPFSGSEYSSATTGIARPTRGTITRRPTSAANRESSGCTATAVSPSIVSGRVVATVMYSPGAPSTGYFRYQRLPFISRLSTSRSEIAVSSLGSQFTSRRSR